jgi:hypothetical protein
VDLAVAAAVPYLHRRSGDQMSSMELPTRRRLIRSRALLLMSVALAFYFGFIALALFRHH